MGKRLKTPLKCEIRAVENFVKKVQKSAKKVLIFSYVYAII